MNNKACDGKNIYKLQIIHFLRGRRDRNALGIGRLQLVSYFLNNKMIRSKCDKMLTFILSRW